MASFSLDLSRVILKHRRTKIIASLGSASWEAAGIEALVAAGVELFRLDLGCPEIVARLAQLVGCVRQASDAAGRHCAILADLSPPRAAEAAPEAGGGEALAVPDGPLQAALSEDARGQAVACAELGVDWLGVAGVRGSADVLALKLFLDELGHAPPVVARIDNAEALQNVAAILQVADAVLISRGKLAAEVPPEEVPIIQQELIRAARAARRPVIVATQMLESMIRNPEPTRAEVSDIASAAMAGVDAVMLSDETAQGQHPVAAVEAMDRALRLVEGYQWKHGQFGQLSDDIELLDPSETLGVALSRAASRLSRDLKARAIVVPTTNERVARILASSRPAAPIIAAHTCAASCRRLGLYWGLIPQLVEAGAMAEPAELARDLVHRLGVAQEGQLFLLVWDLSCEETGVAATVTVISA